MTSTKKYYWWWWYGTDGSCCWIKRSDTLERGEEEEVVVVFRNRSFKTAANGRCVIIIKRRHTRDLYFRAGHTFLGLFDDSSSSYLSLLNDVIIILCQRPTPNQTVACTSITPSLLISNRNSPLSLKVQPQQRRRLIHFSH